MRLYHLFYRIRHVFAGVPRDEAVREARLQDEGACTAVLIGSLLYPEDGSYSAAFSSCDGRTGGPLAPGEVWKAWLMLTRHLADDPDLSSNKRDACRQVFEQISTVIFERGAAAVRAVPLPNGTHDDAPPGSDPKAN